MKAIVPTKATAVPVRTLTRRSEKKRSRTTSTPKLRARSEPRRNAVSCQDDANESGSNARDHDQRESQIFFLIGSRQAAEGPEHELLQRLLARDELHDGDQAH